MQELRKSAMMAKIERVAILNMVSFYHVLYGVASGCRKKKAKSSKKWKKVVDKVSDTVIL